MRWAWAQRYKRIKEREFPASLLITLRVVKGPQPLKFSPALTTCASKRMKTGGFRTLRVLPPRNECERQNPKKTRKSGH